MIETPVKNNLIPIFDTTDNENLTHLSSHVQCAWLDISAFNENSVVQLLLTLLMTNNREQ